MVGPANIISASALRFYLVSGFPSRWWRVLGKFVACLEGPLSYVGKIRGGTSYCPLAARCGCAPFAESPPDLVVILDMLTLTPHLLDVNGRGVALVG